MAHIYGDGAMPPFPLADPNFVMTVLSMQFNNSSRTSKFRHSLTNKHQLLVPDPLYQGFASLNPTGGRPSLRRPPLRTF